METTIVGEAELFVGVDLTSWSSPRLRVSLAPCGSLRFRGSQKKGVASDGHLPVEGLPLLLPLQIVKS